MHRLFFLVSLFFKGHSKFEVFPQPFEPVFTLIHESRFNSFCWVVLVLENNGLFWLVLTHPS